MTSRASRPAGGAQRQGVSRLLRPVATPGDPLSRLVAAVGSRTWAGVVRAAPWLRDRWRAQTGR